MRIHPFVFPLAVLTCACSSGAGEQDPGEPARLTEVASFGDSMPTGVAVSKSGRIFVTFPRLFVEEELPTVAELLPDGTTKAYPDASWNAWTTGEDGGSKFIVPQSAVLDASDHLWIIDNGAPFPLSGGTPTTAKLVEIDIANDSVVRTIPFDDGGQPGKFAGLNDVRLDPDGTHAYLTDPVAARLVVVDLAQGTARIALESSPSTAPEPGFVLRVEGSDLLFPNGMPVALGADGIAIAGDWLYYHAVTAKALYRVPRAALRDASLPPDQLVEVVEKVAETGAHDGIEADGAGEIFLTGLEHNAIRSVGPDGEVHEVVADERLHWPDSIAIGPDGALYVTTSQIHLLPPFRGGKDARKDPHRLFRVDAR